MSTSGIIFHTQILKHYIDSVIFIDIGSREEFGEVSLARGHKKVGNPCFKSCKILVKFVNY